MDPKEIKKLVKQTIVPYITGLRNEIEDGNKTLKEIFETQKKNLKLEYDLEIESNDFVGPPGKTPVADKDYPSILSVQEYIQKIIPKKGKDFFNDADINEIIVKVSKLVKPGKKGKDGVVDYATVKKLAKPLIDDHIKDIKAQIKKIEKEIYKEIKETPKLRIRAEEIVRLLESLKGSARLDASAIKGLEKFVTLIIGGSGGGGGVSTFLQLQDTPSAYTGHALKVTRVKSDETGLEFYTITGYTDEMAQDAVGAMIDSTLSYNDATPSLGINLANANTWTGQQTFNTTTPIFGVAPTFSTMTAGSILFAGTAGLLSQDNANFFWDDTNNRLGVGTNSPAAAGEFVNALAGNQLRVRHTATNSAHYADIRILNNLNSTARMLELGYTSSVYSGAILVGGITGESAFVQSQGAFPLQFGTGSTYAMGIDSSQRVMIGGTSTTYKFDVTGTFKASGNSIIGTVAQGSLLVGYDTVITSLGYGNLSDNVIQLGDNVSTSDFQHTPTLIFTTKQTGTGQLAGRWLAVNSNLASADKRIGQMYFLTGSATNSGILGLDLYNAGTIATVLWINSDGKTGLGSSSPSARLHLLSTTEQFRSGYDTSNYWNATTSSAGAVTFDAVGASAGFSFSDPVTATQLTSSGLTAGRVTFAGTAGILVDDADFTFATDTLTVTKIAAATYTGTVTFDSIATFDATMITHSIAIGDGYELQFGTTTGTHIGTATTEKIGFWNTTPVVQPTTGISAGSFTANTSGIVDDTATFDGYTLGQVVRALRTIGLLA